MDNESYIFFGETKGLFQQKDFMGAAKMKRFYRGSILSRIRKFCFNPGFDEDSIEFHDCSCFVPPHNHIECVYDFEGYETCA